MTPAMMLLIFDAIIKFARDENINKIEYKCIPYPYHKKPAEEDRYALFRFNSKLVRRDVSSTVYLQEQIRFSKLRKRCINKGKKEGIKVTKSENFKRFLANTGERSCLKSRSETRSFSCRNQNVIPAFSGKYSAVPGLEGRCIGRIGLVYQ